MKRLSYVLAAILITLFACLGVFSQNKTAVSSSPNSVAPDEGPLVLNADRTRFSIQHAGIERRGEVFVAPTLDRSKSVVLVIAIHGLGSRASELRAIGFDTFAEQLNAVLIYPDGINNRWDVEPGRSGQSDDIGFFRSLITQAAKMFSVDRGHTFVTGHSMGAFMTYRIGYELSDIVSAIAPIAGVFVTPRSPADPSKPKPVALLHVHASDDEVVPMGGYLGYSMSVAEGINFWFKVDKTDPTPKTRSVENGKTTITYGGGLAPISTVTFAHGGHAWPPGVAKLVMDFFQAYSSGQTGQ